MKIKPVSDAPTPMYPDKHNEEIRRILAAAKPHRWVGTPLIGALTAVIALGLSGCDFVSRVDNAANGTLTPSPQMSERPTDFYNITMGTPASIFAPNYEDIMFVPLFEYGVGTGSVGCVAVIAPVFLSEEEAFAILSAAFADAGITMWQGGSTLRSINLPVTNVQGRAVEPNATLQGHLAPTGRLEGYNLPVAFVSTRDVRNWHQDIVSDEPILSMTRFNVIRAARTLAENNPRLVVFYDPIEGKLDYRELWALKRESGESDEDFYARRSALKKELEQAARTESEEMLRRQIDAFIAWLADWRF